MILFHCVNIPHFVCILISSWGIWAVSVWLWWIMLLWPLRLNICFQFSWVEFSLGVEFLGHKLSLCLPFWGTAQLLAQVATSSTITPGLVLQASCKYHAFFIAVTMTTSKIQASHKATGPVAPQLTIPHAENAQLDCDPLIFLQDRLTGVPGLRVSWLHVFFRQLSLVTDSFPLSTWLWLALVTFEASDFSTEALSHFNLEFLCFGPIITLSSYGSL